MTKEKIIDLIKKALFLPRKDASQGQSLRGDETGGVGANITTFRDYFTTSSSTPPDGLNYDILNWVYIK